MRTWIAGVAVCAVIVPGDLVDEILEGLLVARLLALAQNGGHGQVSRVTMTAAMGWAEENVRATERAEVAEEKARQGAGS